MEPSLLRRSRLVSVVLLAFAIGCRGSGAAPPISSEVHPVVPKVSQPVVVRDGSATATPGDASATKGPGIIKAATAWIDALRRGDVSALASLSRYPFELRDTGKEGHCPKRRAVTGPQDMQAAVHCLVADDVLGLALKDNPEPVVDELPPAKLPAWAAPWRAEVSEGVHAVAVPIDAAASTFDIVLLVADDGVRAFWKSGKIVRIKEPW
jgi:hypothetical protein